MVRKATEGWKDWRLNSGLTCNPARISSPRSSLSPVIHILQQRKFSPNFGNEYWVHKSLSPLEMLKMPCKNSYRTLFVFLIGCKHSYLNRDNQSSSSSELWHFPANILSDQAGILFHQIVESRFPWDAMPNNWALAEVVSIVWLNQGFSFPDDKNNGEKIRIKKWREW